MVRSYLALAGIALTGLGLSAVVNCSGGVETAPGTGGSSSSTTTSDTTASTGATTGTGMHLDPPPPGPTMPPDGAKNATFAISKLYLGETNPDGTLDQTNAWKQYGFDLDGKISTATSTDLCKPRDSATAKDVYPDGNGGIDNSFGKNILPIILPLLGGTPSSTVDDAIASGRFTLMLDMQKLGTGPSYNPIVTQLYAGADLGASPKFDGTDQWPVRPELLNDATDITKGSKVSFATSYLTNNTWVSGTSGNVTLALTISGFTLNLSIAHAFITLQLDDMHKHGTHGIIAGVLDTQQLTDEVKMLAGVIQPSLCSGAVIDGLVKQIGEASDILNDATQDPTKECNGISIGIGFDAELVQLGSIAPPSSPAANPCADGG